MRIVLKIEYDGTDYCGWQVQLSGVTVQGVIEEAIKKLTGEKVTVIGSGRTDSGVHAAGQIAHFDITSEKIPPAAVSSATRSFEIMVSHLASEPFAISVFLMRTSAPLVTLPVSYLPASVLPFRKYT